MTCTCALPGSPSEELERSTAVFSGRVVGIEVPSGRSVSSAELVEPNRGLVYEGEILWETDRSKEEASAVLDGVRIRIAWTFDYERRERVFPANTDEGPNVFPTPESWCWTSVDDRPTGSAIHTTQTPEA